MPNEIVCEGRCRSVPFIAAHIRVSRVKIKKKRYFFVIAIISLNISEVYVIAHVRPHLVKKLIQVFSSTQQ
jgi:hypothetical protein